MKRMFLVMAIAIVTVLQVSAQDNNRQMTAQQRTEQRIKQMDEKLNLTDEQETKIRELYANFNKQKYPREKRKEAMEKLTADISLLLTVEQQTIYKQMTEQAIAEMKKGKRNNGKRIEIYHVCVEVWILWHRESRTNDTNFIETEV